MNITVISHRLFIASGIGILLCIPAIINMDNWQLAEWPFRISQLVLGTICSLSAGVYALCTGSTPTTKMRGLAIIAAVFSASWVGLIATIVAKCDLGWM